MAGALRAGLSSSSPEEAVAGTAWGRAAALFGGAFAGVLAGSESATPATRKSAAVAALRSTATPSFFMRTPARRARGAAAPQMESVLRLSVDLLRLRVQRQRRPERQELRDGVLR